MIIVESKRKIIENILKKHPNAVVADVTSQAKDGLVRLSPFYPHGGIPVPFSEGYTATCVEGIWQGLKVFENEDIDTSMFRNNTMKGIKRTVASMDVFWDIEKVCMVRRFLDIWKRNIKSIFPRTDGCWSTKQWI